MPRCPDCNRFVSLDTDNEPETDDLEVSVEEMDGELSIALSGSVRIANACGNCSTELTEATFDVDESETIPWPEDLPKDADLTDAQADTCSAERTQETVDKDRHGKPIKKARYMKTEYGYSAEIEITLGGVTLTTFRLSDTIGASSMEECC